MIRVYNGTGALNVVSDLGITMRPGEWTALPWAQARHFVGRPGYKVEMHEDVLEPFLWKEEDGLHVYWLSPWSVSDGYSNAAEVMVHGLIATGAHLDVNAVWFDSRRGLRQETIDLLQRPSLRPHKVGICLAQPEEFIHLPTPYRIGWTMWETDDPLEKKPHWRHACNAVDLLLVPCDENKAVFERFVKVPVMVAPLAHDPRYTYVERPADRPLTVVTWGSLSGRKGPLEAIDCFQKAFSRETHSEVRMILKTKCGCLGGAPHNIPPITDERITVIDEDWRDIRKMVALAASADVGIFLSKGEGFGLPAREAMATGLPTILADNTGHMDICSTRYNFPVPTVRVEPSPMGGRWHIPDNDVAIEHLRWIYEHRDAALEVGRRGAWYLAANHDQCAAARHLIAILAKLDPCHTERQTTPLTWEEMYTPVEPETLRHLQRHHAHFFKIIAEFASPPATLLEIGLGTGAFYGKLVEEGYQVIGLDSNSRVIEVARQNLAQLGLDPVFIQGDAFNLGEPPYHIQVVYHQGLLEHFSDAEIRAMITESLRVAPYVIFSVPSVYYPEQTKGDERLLSLEQWRAILDPFRVVRLEYYQSRLHILAVIERGENIRGVMLKRRGEA